MKTRNILLTLSLALASTQSYGWWWDPEPEPTPDPGPSLEVVRNNGQLQNLLVKGLKIKVPSQLRNKIQNLAEDHRRSSWGTDMFGIESLASETGSGNSTIFGADFMALGFKCTVQNQIDSIYRQINHQNGEIDDRGDILLFKQKDYKDSYVFNFGVIDKVDGECYSVSINTYGPQKLGLGRPTVRDALDFIIQPVWQSLRNVRGNR